MTFQINGGSINGGPVNSGSINGTPAGSPLPGTDLPNDNGVDLGSTPPQQPSSPPTGETELIA